MNKNGNYTLDYYICPLCRETPEIGGLLIWLKEQLLQVSVRRYSYEIGSRRPLLPGYAPLAGDNVNWVPALFDDLVTFLRPIVIQAIIDRYSGIISFLLPVWLNFFPLFTLYRRKRPYGFIHWKMTMWVQHNRPYFEPIGTVFEPILLFFSMMNP